MARNFVWHSVRNGIRDAVDHSVSLYNGPGTVWRITGSLMGASSSSSPDEVALWSYVVNVGAAAADPNLSGADPAGVMLHGGAFALVPANATAYTTPQPVDLETEGRRVIGAGEQVWLRMRAVSGGFQWFWLWEVRVLVLLPEP